MRERRRGLKVNCKVERQLGRVYRLIRQQYKLDKCNCIGGRSDEDIFDDTIMFLLGDKEAEDLTDSEMVDHFKRRFNMVRFQTYKDYEKKREVSRDKMWTNKSLNKNS